MHLRFFQTWHWWLTGTCCGQRASPSRVCPVHHQREKHELIAIGDAHTLFAARAEVRKNFESNRNLRIGSEELEKSLVHAEEVSKFLRENVVQGQADESEGKYSTLQTTSLILVTAANKLQSYGYTSTPNEGTTRISKRERERVH